MSANQFGLAALALAVAVSVVLYDHRRRHYAENKDRRIESGSSFALAYRYIQLSTVVAGLGAFLTDQPWVLRCHDLPVLVVTGSIVALSGSAVFAVAKLTLGRHYSPCFDSFVPAAIVQAGVYAWVRHPIYTANFLVMGGLALSSGSAWLALNLVLLVAYYTRAARAEEAALAASFAGYRDYIGRTGRFFPRLPSARALRRGPAPTGHTPQRS